MANLTLSTRMADVEGTLYSVVTNPGEINTTLKLANGGSHGAPLWKIIKNRAIDAVILGGVLTVVVLLAFGKTDVGQLIELLQAARGAG